MNHTNRFDGKGDIYAKARPKYANELFIYLKNTMQIGTDRVFADIGSGTGIFTEQLLNCGYTVYAVEPNADMRRKAEEKMSNCNRFHSIHGTAGNTTLEDSSIDCITAAQAFHWFDAAAFQTECRRILKPGGKILLVYNSRDIQAECTKALAELRQEYNPDFHGFSNGINSGICCSFFNHKCTVLQWDNSLTYDRQGYIDRLLSSSYSLREDHPRYAEYLESIHRLFERFAVDGKITIPVNTVAYIGYA